MHDLRKKILEVFLKNPSTEYSTSEIVENVFPEEYEFIEGFLDEDETSEKAKLGKRKKAKLHRRTLYHINKLKEKGMILHSRTRGKGEKFFVLNPENNRKEEDKELEDLVRKYTGGSTDFFKLTGLERYKDLGVLKKYDKDHWTTRINSILLEPTGDLKTKIKQFLPCINDVIGIRDFQRIMQNYSSNDLQKFLKAVDSYSLDHGKFVNYLIDIDKIDDVESLEEFLAIHTEIKPKNAFVIIQSDLQRSDSKKALEKVVTYFREAGLRLNFQNKNIRITPYLIGELGSYTIKHEDWKNYKSSKTELGMAVSETSIYVDMDRFNEKLGLENFHSFTEKVTKSLLLATSTRRNKADRSFRPVLEYEKEDPKQFFNFCYNHIKIWRSDFDQEGHYIDCLKSVKPDLKNLSKNQETIFKSTGLPIRFRVALSKSFSSFDEDFFSSDDQNIVIHSVKDFDKQDIKKKLKEEENYARIFNLGSRTKIYRENNFEPSEIQKEFKQLESYQLPLITYEFRQGSRTKKLEEYL